MISIFYRLKNKFLAGVLLGGAIVLPAHAVKDVLDTPAVMSEMATESLLLDVAPAGNRLVSVGARGHILFSDDQGRSWQQASVPVSVLLTAVHFPDEKHGWAVGHGGVILHSSDGGKSWIKQFDGNIANKSIIDQAQAVVTKLEEELETASEEMIGDLEYDLEDAQFSFEDAQIDAEIGASKPFLDVHFKDRSNGFAVGAYGFIFKTVDGGQTWENFGDRMENQDRFHLNAIVQLENDVVLVAGEAGTMFRSIDGGDSWETVDSPYDGSFFGLSGTGEAGVVLAFGLRGNLFRSEDYGETWERVDSGTQSTLMGGGFDDNGNVSIVGNSGSVIFSSDGGRTFVERVRENRLGNVALVFTGAGHMVIVGESGVNVTTPAGKNL